MSEGGFFMLLPVPFLLTGIFVLNWGKRMRSALLSPPDCNSLFPSLCTPLPSAFSGSLLQEEQVRGPLFMH